MDPEALNSQVTKYAKFVTQLEKGLPPNNVVPQLKYKVERMKEKVSQADIISEPDADALVLFQEKKITVQPVCLNNWPNGAVECGEEETPGVCQAEDRLRPRCWYPQHAGSKQIFLVQTATDPIVSHS